MIPVEVFTDTGPRSPVKMKISSDEQDDQSTPDFKDNGAVRLDKTKLPPKHDKDVDVDVDVLDIRSWKKYPQRNECL